MNRMKKRLSRRGWVRVISYISALVIALAGLRLQQHMLKLQYRAQVEQTYERALADLADYLENINITLEKGLYVTTPTQTSLLSAQLWREAGGAKMSLSQLPVSGTDIDGIYRFLSQVGDYSMTLSKQTITGKAVQDEDRRQLKAMSEYASELSRQVGDMQGLLSGGELWAGEVEQIISQSGELGEESFAASLAKNAEALTDYPTLIYDGPFSDHIMQQEPKLTKGKTEISEEQAKIAAAHFMQVEPEQLTNGGDETGTLPCFTFNTKDGGSVAVTKAGGYCVYMNKPRNVDSQTLDFDAALNKAQAYLKSCNLDGFTDSYYMISEGVCVINFAYTQNGVVCYPDLIKVGVALDNGEIVSVEARTYVMNHHDRAITNPSHTVEEAQKVLSPLLTPEKNQRCIALTSGLNEVSCYEFLCKTDEDKEILIYVNTETLEEEFVFLLLKTDGGVLTQ